MYARLLFLIKAAAICFAAMWIMTGTADAACGGKNERTCKIGFKCDNGYAAVGKKCKPCGRKDQPACVAVRPGPQCLNYLEKINGTCRARGGQGQRPYSGAGFDCRPGYNVGSDGNCTRCGGKDQVECEALRKGPQCNSGLENYKNICRKWGQEGEKPWPKIRPGFPCDKGLVTETNSSTNKDECVKCGGEDQPMCRATRPGPQCRDYLGEVDGYCRPRGKEGQQTYEGIGFDCAPGFNVGDDNLCTACGGNGQISCEVMRKGPRCNVGFTEEDGICEPDVIAILSDRVKDAMKESIATFADNLIDMADTAQKADESDAARRAFNVAEDNYKATKGLRSNGSSMRVNTADIPDNEGCLGGHFNSWSIGFGGEAGVIGGDGGEAGMVFRCADHQANQQDSKWYASKIKNYSAGGGASVGVTVGMWKADFDNLAGPSHGFTLGLSDAFSTLQAASVSTRTMDKFDDLLKASFELSLSAWYVQNNDGSIGDFAGLSVTLSKGVGVNAGGIYSDVTTYQLP